MPVLISVFHCEPTQFWVLFNPTIMQSLARIFAAPSLLCLEMLIQRDSVIS